MHLHVELDHVHGDVPHPAVLIGHHRINGVGRLRRVSRGRQVTHRRQTCCDHLLDSALVFRYPSHVEGFEVPDVRIRRFRRLQRRASAQQHCGTRDRKGKDFFQDNFPVLMPTVANGILLQIVRYANVRQVTSLAAEQREQRPTRRSPVSIGIYPLVTGRSPLRSGRSPGRSAALRRRDRPGSRRILHLAASYSSAVPARRVSASAVIPDTKVSQGQSLDLL